MWQIVLLLTFCQVVSASPFMPRFSGSGDDNHPVVQESNGISGVTWTVGSSDRIAYVDRCQNLSIRVAPEFLPWSSYYFHSKLRFQFKCYAKTNRTIEQEIAAIRFYNSTRVKTAVRIPVCDSLEPSAFVLVKKNATDYQLLTPGCPNKLGTASKTVSNIRQLSIRLVANLSNESVFIQSGNLTVSLFSSFHRLSLGVGGWFTGESLISPAAVNKIKELSNGDDSVWGVQFLTQEVLNMINTLPLYLQQKLNIGVVFTSVECSSFSDNNSVAIVSNAFGLGLSRGKNLTQSIRFCKPANSYFIDLKAGILYSSNTYLIAKLVHKWSKLKLNLKVCEIFRFSGHGLTYVRELFFLLIKLPNVTLRVNSCNTVPGPVEAPLLDILEIAGKPELYTCPIVCQVPKDVTCKLAQFLDASNASNASNVIHNYTIYTGINNYTCKAGNADTVVRIQSNILAQFIANNDSTLPSKIFALEGESISYSCSAAVSPVPPSGNNHGNKSTAIKKISTYFYVHETARNMTSGTKIWKRLRGPINGTSVAVSEIKSLEGIVQMVNVTIRKVPSASDGGNISHRFVCQLTADAVQATSLYGMPVFSCEMSADVVYVPRPTDESFSLEVLNDTTFIFSLDPIFVAYLSEVGAEMLAAFRIGGMWLNASHPLVRSKLLSSSFQSTTGSLILTVGTTESAQPLPRDLSATRLVDLIAVFSFHYPTGTRIGSLRQLVSTRAPRRLLGSVECTANPRCFYTTDYEGEAAASSDGVLLTELLTVNLNLS